MRLLRLTTLPMLFLGPLFAAAMLLWGLHAFRSNLLLHETTTYRSDLPAIVEEIRDLNRLETASFHAEKIVEAKSTVDPLPSWLAGDRVLLVAHGVVTAGVDLSRLRPSDVRSAADGLHIRLPAAEILSTSLDDRSFVYDHHPGLFSGINASLETQARQKAEDEVRSAALTSGLLSRADRIARTDLARILRLAGVRHLVFD